MGKNELTSEQYLEIVDDFLLALTKEVEQPVPANLNTKQKRWLIDTLLEMRTTGDTDKTLLDLQDKILTYELNQKGLKNLSDFKFNQNTAKFSCGMDILNVDVDVVFVPMLLTGVDDNIENDRLLMLGAGLQIKEDFALITQENHNVLPKNKIYACRGYNLPSKYVAKIILPNEKNISASEYTIFDNALKSVFEFMKNNNFKSVAFDAKYLESYDFALFEILNREIKLNRKKYKILLNS